MSLIGNSLAVQWLGLCPFTAEGRASIPGRGTQIPQAASAKKKKKRLCSALLTSFIKVTYQVQLNSSPG